MHQKMENKARTMRAAKRMIIGLYPFTPGHFLMALVAFIFVTPFVDRPPYGEQVEAVMLTMVMLLGALAVGGRQRTFLLAIILVIPAVAAKWLDRLVPGAVPAYFTPALSVIFMSLIIATLIRFVLRAGIVNRDVVCAAVSAYISMGLLWAFAYMLVVRLSTGAFAVLGETKDAIDPFQAFYFSFITLVSIGYGDITPASRVTQMLAVLEGMSGMFFVVILISRLVALYSSKQQSEDAAAKT